MVIRSHLVHLVVYSALVASFFALIVHRDSRRRVRFAVLTWLAMTGGALALAYLMFPFPR